MTTLDGFYPDMSAYPRHEEECMDCRICGDPDAMFYPTKRQGLCPACNRATPHKVSREVFEARYWQGRAADVPYSTRQSFYDDYRASTHEVDAYILATTTHAQGQD